MAEWQLTEELRAELNTTHFICAEYLRALRFTTGDTARDPDYHDNHLLSYLAQDFIESAHAIPLLVEQGIHNVALREARFILEAHIKLCYVQQQEYRSDVQQKLSSFEQVFDSSKIAVKKDVELNLLPEVSRAAFQEETGRLYGGTSNYVHLSRAQIDGRIARVDAGRTAGKESVADVAAVNVMLSRVFAGALVFLFHSVPQYVPGDWFVEYDGSTVDWYFTRSRYIALLDSSFDYKHERQERLREIIVAREAALSF
jgi:hypothetical protein